MTLKKTDLQKTVDMFIKQRTPEHRYTSFDYCYNYFHPDNRLKIGDMEKSCSVLGFYLASWGMMRASFLLGKSIKHYEKTVQYIIDCDSALWKIDVDCYTDNNIEKIFNTYNGIENTIDANKHRLLVLATKILLGVFGFVPAFDRNFCDTFRNIFKQQCGFRSLNQNSLNSIAEFYNANKETINDLSRKTKTLDFTTGEPTKLFYTKAKIIDMYGFQKSNNGKPQN
jgi:hypothetical protein